MKTTVCRIRRNVVPVAMALFLALGAGAALADGEPTDPGDATPQWPLLCPDDPEGGLPGTDWIDVGSGGAVATAARLVVMIATL